MRNLIKFLFADSQEQEDREHFADDIAHIFEDCAAVEALESHSIPLEAALQSLGISVSLLVEPTHVIYSTSVEEDYDNVAKILADPASLYALAEKGWVPVSCGNVSEGDTNCFKIKFMNLVIEADTPCDLDNLIRLSQELGDAPTDQSTKSRKQKEEKVQETADDLINKILGKTLDSGCQ